MKYKIEFEGDYYEDFHELREIVGIRETRKVVVIDSKEIHMNREFTMMDLTGDILGHIPHSAHYILVRQGERKVVFARRKGRTLTNDRTSTNLARRICKAITYASNYLAMQMHVVRWHTLQQTRQLPWLI